MAARTSVPVIAKLLTEYTRGHVQFIIELTPKDGEMFDVPPREIVKELGPCLNYVISRFTGEEAGAPAPEDRAEARKQEAAARERAARLLAEGQARSLQGFERALIRAKARKDPREIADAQLALDRVRARIKANEA